MYFIRFKYSIYNWKYILNFVHNSAFGAAYSKVLIMGKNDPASAVSVLEHPSFETNYL